MLEFLRDVISQTVRGFGERLAAFGPNLLAMLVILLAGVVTAGGLHLLLRLLLPKLGFDRFAQRLGLGLLLRKGGIVHSVSESAAAAAAWTLLAVFVLLAIGALNLQFAMGLLSNTLAYLPQVFIATALLLLGTLASAFVRRSVLIAAVNAGLPSARLLASGAHATLIVIFAAMALEHLGVGRQILVAAFTILFGGVVFGLALAFGLAGRDFAHDLLARVWHSAPPNEDRDARRHL